MFHLIPEKSNKGKSYRYRAKEGRYDSLKVEDISVITRNSNDENDDTTLEDLQ